MLDHTIAIFHHGALAQYRVTESPHGTYIAQLQNYRGPHQDQPPEQFEIRKVGRHWEDEGFDQELTNEIGKAIELTQRREGPVNRDRARRWGAGPESF